MGWSLIFLLLSGCGHIDSIIYSPKQTPETWLSIQPFLKFQFGSSAIILVQPSTSAIVYTLGLLTIGVGYYFIRIRAGQQSRLWWGIALFLWGTGALLAGTSYEAFSYPIKCAGREFCIWTSWWEIVYLIVSVASIDAMLIAQAFSNASGKLRKILVVVAIVNIVLFVIAVLIGSLIPNKFLISFDLLLIVSTPNILIFLFQNSWKYYKSRQKSDLALLGTWIWLILTIAAYFLYLVSGLTQILWAQKIWLSENDVLHIGLISWMVYLAVVVARKVKDQPEIARR